MASIRLTREEAEAEAIRRATEYVASLPQCESHVYRGAYPDRKVQSRSSAHPVGWIVIFVVPTDTDVIVDDGELFIAVNLETGSVSIYDYSK